MYFGTIDEDLDLGLLAVGLIDGIGTFVPLLMSS